MSDPAKFPHGRRARYSTALAALATFAVGLAAAFAGAWLLLPAPTPAPEPPPGAATDRSSRAAPAANAHVAPSAPAPARLADIVRLARVIDRNLALYRLADGLDAAGVERLLAEAGALERANERDPATWILYARYVELDPEAALRHALAGGAATERWLYAVIEVWARTDLDAALRHAQTLGAHQRTPAVAAILRARDDLPRETRAGIAARLPRQSGLQSIVAQQGLADDPARAWRQALARQESGQMRDHALRYVAFRWAAADPRAALAGIGSTDEVDARTRDELRRSVVRQWAEADPAAALDWVMAQQASQSRSDLIDSVLLAWADADPRAAAAWLNVLENQALAGDWLGWVGQKYASRHPEEAVDWLLALPADDGFTEMWSVFHLLAEVDPERTVLLLQRIGDADARNGAEQGLVHGWALTDPAATMAWLDRRVDGDPDQNAMLISVLLDQWAETDAASAVRHLDRLTDPVVRDSTIVDMLDAVLRHDVSLAETLFDRIEDEDLRQEAAQALYEHLRDIDPARAERYR